MREFCFGVLCAVVFYVRVFISGSLSHTSGNGEERGRVMVFGACGGCAVVL